MDARISIIISFRRRIKSPIRIKLIPILIRNFDPSLSKLEKNFIIYNQLVISFSVGNRSVSNLENTNLLSMVTSKAPVRGLFWFDEILALGCR